MRDAILSRGTAAAIGAAVLFGSSTPAAKNLLATTEPVMLAALLYLGAGLGLSLLRLATATRDGDTGLRSEDLPAFLGVVLTGAVLAPLLLLVGLRHVSAVVGSLLLNLEGPVTVLLAVAVFGDHLSGRAAVGTAAMMLGAATLGLTGSADIGGDIRGVLAVVGACLGWAVDNNLMQRLSLRDPRAVAQAKGLLGGSALLLVAMLLGYQAPPAATIVAALLVGFISYGVSVALAVYAMRTIGVAREAAWFSSAPFVGVAIGALLLHEPLGMRELTATVFMLIGLGLLATERHEHRHTHTTLQHEHRHVHDEHHRHAHRVEDPPSEPHAHAHTHDALEHAHPHAPDLHHRHH